MARLSTGYFPFTLLVLLRSWLTTSPPTLDKARTVPFASVTLQGGLFPLGSPCLDPTSLPNSVFATSALFSRNSVRSTNEGWRPISKSLPDSSAHFACMCTGRRITILVKVSIELMSASYLISEEFSWQIRMSRANWESFSPSEDFSCGPLTTLSTRERIITCLWPKFLLRISRAALYPSAPGKITQFSIASLALPVQYWIR